MEPLEVIDLSVGTMLKSPYNLMITRNGIGMIVAATISSIGYYYDTLSP